MALAGSAKELKPLLDEIKANGFKVVPSGKHHKVVDVEGKLGAKNKVVTDTNGPIIISSTPGDFRARDMHVKRLKGAGIIKRDPWAKDKGEAAEGRKKGFSEDDKARARERIAQESRRREERTKQLRSRVEPIVMKLGGWERRGATAELGRVAMYFAAKAGKKTWASESSAMQNAHQLKKGNTLSDQAVDAWNLLCDELEKAWRRGPGTTPNDEALRERWFELVREEKGIKPDPPPPDPRKPGPVIRTQIKPPGETEPEEESASNNGRVHHVGPLSDKTPTVALKAVFLMSQSADSEQMDDVLAVGEDILRLEMASLDAK